MFKKHLWKSDIFSKDAGHRPPSILKMSHFHRCFSNILLVKNNYLVCPWKRGSLSNHLVCPFVLGHRPASLLKISLFHRCFLNILLVKTNHLVLYVSETLVENGLKQKLESRMLKFVNVGCASITRKPRFC